MYDCIWGKIFKRINRTLRDYINILLQGEREDCVGNCMCILDYGHVILLQGESGTCSVPMSSTKHPVTPSSPKTAPSSQTA